MYSYGLCNSSNAKDASNKDKNYHTISITNLVIDNLCEKSVLFKEVCTQCKAASILASIDAYNNDLLPENVLLNHS